MQYTSALLSPVNQLTTPANWENIDQQNFHPHEGIREIKDTGQFQKKLVNNLNLAAALTERIYREATGKHGVKIKKVLLKSESVIQYDALFFIEMDDYLTDKLREVYNLSHSIKADINNNDFYISFKFIPYSENLDMELIRNDGFIFEYAGNNE